MTPPFQEGEIISVFNGTGLVNVAEVSYFGASAR